MVWGLMGIATTSREQFHPVLPGVGCYATDILLIEDLVVMVQNRNEGLVEDKGMRRVEQMAERYRGLKGSDLFQCALVVA